MPKRILEANRCSGHVYVSSETSGPDVPCESLASNRMASGSSSWLQKYSVEGIWPGDVNREMLKPSSMSLNHRTRSSSAATTQKPPPSSPHGDSCHLLGGT